MYGIFSHYVHSSDRSESPHCSRNVPKLQRLHRCSGMHACRCTLNVWARLSPVEERRHVPKASIPWQLPLVSRLACCTLLDAAVKCASLPCSLRRPFVCLSCTCTHPEYKSREQAPAGRDSELEEFCQRSSSIQSGCFERTCIIACGCQGSKASRKETARFGYAQSSECTDFMPCLSICS